MGNCCTVESSDSEDWAGEDWGSLTSKHRSTKISSRKVFDEDHHKGVHDDDGLMKLLGNVEKEKLLGALRASSDSNGKVKIMISKKELDKLLKGSSDKKQSTNSNNHYDINRGSSSAELVLARLIYAKDHYDHRDVHHRHWKPALQSIPEVN